MIKTLIANEVTPTSWRKHYYGLSEVRWNGLAEKTFWVTGAGTGIGQAVACALGTANANVILTGRREDKLRETIELACSHGADSSRFLSFPCDLTDARQTEAACDQVEGQKALNGIIHAAALPSRPGSQHPLTEDPWEYWDALLGTNVRAPWHLTRRLLPHMLRSGNPRVVMISSLAGWHGTAGFGMYNVSKAALNSLCISLARECECVWPGQDVQINTVIPGEVRSEMNQGTQTSPFVTVPMMLTLLTQPMGGPNGRFFLFHGGHVGFGDAPPYPCALEAPEQAHLRAVAKERSEQGLSVSFADVLQYDHGPRDRRIIDALAARLLAEPGPIAAYGASRFLRYCLELAPSMASRISLILEDDPTKRVLPVAGIPVVSCEMIPADVRTVFLGSDVTATCLRMMGRLTGQGLNVNRVALDASLTSCLHVVPAKAWRKPERSIYPIEIPELAFAPLQDMILLELPPRYQPMLPNGVGHVHNILARTGIRFQTVDCNILFYHRFHMRRVLDGSERLKSPAGKELPLDPWDIVHIEAWQKEDLLTYFAADLEELAARLIASRPKMVGISLSGFNRVVASRLIQRLRQGSPDTLIIVGGYDCVHPTVGKNRFCDFDYMVVGEAELSLGPLVTAVARGEKPANLPGILSRFDTEGRAFVPAPKPKDLDAIGYPRYEWANLELYRLADGSHLVPFISSRGCAWSRCRFCAECFEYRSRSAESVLGEIEHLYARGFRIFQFNESDMNGSPDILMELCRKIIDRKLDIRLCGQLRIDRRSTPGFFETLRKAGCASLRFGVDGWSDHTLKLQRKGYHMRLVEQNLRDCRAAGISAAVNLVVGVPGETEQNIDESIQNLVKLAPHYDLLENIHTLILAFGNEYHRNPDEYKIGFRQDRETLYRTHLDCIPPDLWFSEEPYIDQKIRIARVERICRALHEAGVKMGGYAQHMVKKILSGGERVAFAQPGADLSESLRNKPQSDAVAAKTNVESRHAQHLPGRFSDFAGALEPPKIIEIEPTNYCNLRCKACHVSFASPCSPASLDVKLVDRLNLSAQTYVILGSVYEPTIHPRFKELLNRLAQNEPEMEMITNGTSLDAEMIAALKALRLRFLTISFDGATASTYESIRRGARFDRVLSKVLSLKEALSRRDTFFLINYTLMRSNLHEIIPTLSHWEKHGMDALNIISMVVRALQPDVLRESLYPIREQVAAALDQAAEHVINTKCRMSVRAPYFSASPLAAKHPASFSGMSVKSNHPGAKHTVIPRAAPQRENFPGMAWPCRSPFTLARVLSDGDIQLCYKHVIGNLHEESMEAIWFGRKATGLRKRLMSDDSACRSCDYYRFALCEESIDLNDPKMHFAEPLVPWVDRVNFDTGEAEVEQQVRPPRLLGSVGRINLVAYGSRYYGLPQELGPVQLEREDVSRLRGVITAESLETLKQRILEPV